MVAGRRVCRVEQMEKLRRGQLGAAMESKEEAVGSVRDKEGGKENHGDGWVGREREECGQGRGKEEE